MTLSEFKAWFEGFTEGMDGPPSLKQWERIQARVKEITGSPVTERHYIDRYWPSARPHPYWQLHNSGIVFSAAGVSHNGVLNAGSCQGAVGNVAFAVRTRPVDETDTSVFDSHAAMALLGKADAAELKAA